jgi:hypothetical protein
MPRISLIASRTWDESKLQQIFFDGNVADIKQIPVSGAGIYNYLAWNFT